MAEELFRRRAIRMLVDRGKLDEEAARGWLSWPHHAGQATDRGRRPHPITGQDSLRLDPLERLARLCQHIPRAGFHRTRL